MARNLPNWQSYPNLPHILVLRESPNSFLVRDARTGESVRTDEGGVHSFAADHSRGLGSVVHRVAKAVGAERCTPCAKRQAAMNGVTGKLRRFFS